MASESQLAIQKVGTKYSANLKLYGTSKDTMRKMADECLVSLQELRSVENQHLTNIINTLKKQVTELQQQLTVEKQKFALIQQQNTPVSGSAESTAPPQIEVLPEPTDVNLKAKTEQNEMQAKK